MKSRKVKAYMKKKSSIPLEESGSGEEFKYEESSDDDRDIEAGDSSEEEEVLPITDDEESEEEMDEEDDLPTLDNWGKRKGVYYNTDFVDQDRGKSYREEDLEKANAEREAASMQLEALVESHLTDAMIFQDYGQEKVSKETQNILTDDDTDSEKDDADEKEREKLKQEKLSLELLELLKEYKRTREEVESRLAPILNVKDILNLPESTFQLLNSRYVCFINYMMLVILLMIMKRKGNVPANHPIYNRLNIFKKIEELYRSNKNLQKAIDFLVKELKHKDPSLVAKEFAKYFKHSKTNSTISKTNAPEKKKSVTFQEQDDKEEMEIDADEDETTIENSEEKRKITYQIAKNKGLKQRRNKRYRNPRVNNKIKFKKACIRRKGQVKQVVKEMYRYGGELTGISSHVVRSVKFK